MKTNSYVFNLPNHDSNVYFSWFFQNSTEVQIFFSRILLFDYIVWYIKSKIPVDFKVDISRFMSHYLYSKLAAAAKSLQSCPTLCDPIDGSPPGSTVPGILQAR